MTQPTVPITPVTASDLRDPAWWTTVITSVLSFATGIGVLIGHPFHSTAITAVIPSVAFFAAAIVPAIFVHGQAKVTAAKIAAGNIATGIHV